MSLFFNSAKGNKSPLDKREKASSYELKMQSLYKSQCWKKKSSSCIQRESQLKFSRTDVSFHALYLELKSLLKVATELDSAPAKTS